MVKRKSKLEKLASAGVGIASEVVGAGAGAFAEQHSPGSGLVVKAAVTTFMISSYKNVGGGLTKKEQVRAEEAMEVAQREISALEAKGFKTRDDDFFQGDEFSGSSKANEFLEGSIRTAMKACQEKKVPFIGHLMSSVSFDSEISSETAHHFIKLADELTFRSYGILGFLGTMWEYQYAMKSRNEPDKDPNQFEKNDYSLMVECFDLYHRGLIWKLDRVNGERQMAWLGSGDFEPRLTVLTPLGRLFVDKLGLRTLPLPEPLLEQIRVGFLHVMGNDSGGAHIDGGTF